MKFKHLVMLFFALLLCLFAVGCGNEIDNHEGQVKIVFELEGGEYQNTKKPVVHYYNLKKDQEETKILELQEVTNNKILKSGYKLKGWYRDRIEGEDKVTYEHPFNFDTDKVSKDGITLYAYWIPNATYKYDLCYLEDDGTKKVLYSYEVNEGETFKDHKNKANSRFGYTAIGFTDKDGNPWNFDFKHPGGDTDLTIDVYVKYIEGRYEIVTNARELKKAKGSNIYLANDIDLGGDELSFNGYNKHFMGNGFTISNFKVGYNARVDGLIEDFTESTKKSLAISLFGDIKDAVIENVHFKDVTVDVKTQLTKTYKIYVSPLANTATNSTIKNVTFEANYGYSELPKGFNPAESLIYITDRAFYKSDEKTVTDKVEITVTQNK